MPSQFVSDLDPPFEAVNTDRGTGFICPHDDCECKFIVNPARFKDCVGSRMNSRGLICPSCERRSPLPKELH